MEKNEVNDLVLKNEAEENAARADAVKLGKLVASILDAKKAMDINLLSLPKTTVIADCFVIATGTSSTHIKSLADEIEFKLEELKGLKPDHIEGFSNSSWVLMDYGAVVIHIFTKEARDFYNLERLWADAETIPLDEQENEN